MKRIFVLALVLLGASFQIAAAEQVTDLETPNLAWNESTKLFAPNYGADSQLGFDLAKSVVNDAGILEALKKLRAAGETDPADASDLLMQASFAWTVLQPEQNAKPALTYQSTAGIELWASGLLNSQSHSINGQHFDARTFY